MESRNPGRGRSGRGGEVCGGSGAHGPPQPRSDRREERALPRAVCSRSNNAPQHRRWPSPRTGCFAFLIPNLSSNPPHACIGTLSRNHPQRSIRCEEAQPVSHPAVSREPRVLCESLLPYHCLSAPWTSAGPDSASILRNPCLVPPPIRTRADRGKCCLSTYQTTPPLCLPVVLPSRCSRSVSTPRRPSRPLSSAPPTTLLAPWIRNNPRLPLLFRANPSGCTPGACGPLLPTAPRPLPRTTPWCPDCRG